MSRFHLYGLVSVCACVAVVSILVLQRPKSASQFVSRERSSIDKLYAAKPKEAKQKYQEFVEQHKSSPDKQVQDQVGAARMRLGYLAAKDKDFKAAQATFREAETQYKGEGKMNPSFGSLPDQAAYQAVVCLVAEGKTKEARTEFRRFIKERPHSPLVHASYRRLVRLNDGESLKEDEDLLQTAVTLQEKKIRFEISVCGPKAIRYLLESYDVVKPTPSYEDVAKRCGTTDSGTSLEGMVKGLESYGLNAKGVSLNRKDFGKLRPPALWLQDRHYLVVRGFIGSNVVVYDPTLGDKRTIKLPPADDASFSATLLVFDADRLLGDKKQ